LAFHFSGNAIDGIENSIWAKDGRMGVGEEGEGQVARPSWPVFIKWTPKNRMPATQADGDNIIIKIEMTIFNYCSFCTQNKDLNSNKLSPFLPKMCLCLIQFHSKKPIFCKNCVFVHLEGRTTVYFIFLNFFLHSF
jgi:hypothetical protein